MYFVEITSVLVLNCFSSVMLKKQKTVIVKIVGILEKLGIVNHFKGDIRLTEGGSESVKKTFATFWPKLGSWMMKNV